MAPLPRRPEFDVAIGYLGKVRHGKTDAAVGRLLAFRKAHPVYLIAHDPQYAIPDKLHDGTPTHVVRHATVAALAHGIGKRPDALHVSMEPDAITLVRFSERLGRASMERADPKGLAAPCPPVLVYIDEVNRCEGATEGKLGEDIRNALLSRRHRHVGIVWSSQSPHRVHYELLGNATELHAFALDKDRDLARLAADSGFSKAEVSQIPNLPKFRCISYVQ